MTVGDKTAVVLFQLGGPDSLEAVEPFLTNLFNDPDIINFPGAFLARRPLAKYIAAKRYRKVADHYREIGGKSPIFELTGRQAAALEQELNRHISSTVYVAMRYWRPFTEEVIVKVKEGHFTKIILLPLYPQFSRATTMSSLKEWRRLCKAFDIPLAQSEPICCYHSHPLYIEALADQITATLKRFTAVQPRDIDLVFSAHGIPVGLIAEGDPYQLQIEATVRSVLNHGAWRSPHSLCYQSKVGPAEWLKPSLGATIRDLAAKGRRHLLIIPVAFVTEHIETLHEINIEAREEAHGFGVQQFEMMPALNDHPKFIECLADLVLKKAKARPTGLAACRALHSAYPASRPPVLCPHWSAASLP